ncbi:MAG: oxygenase MpaB family protein, partial [Perlucidibaca sp.]
MSVATHAGVPTRARPFAKTQVPTPPWLRLLLGRDLAPTQAEFDAALAALHAGDAAMDALVEWMVGHGPREARLLFEQAIAQGVDSIADCPQPLRDFFAVVGQEPAWLDRALLDEGVRFTHGVGELAMVVMRDLALMGGYLLSGFNQALVMTGALSQGTSQRVAETGKWWMDCTEPDGLARHGPGFRSTLHVRLVHALVRRNLQARPEWDHAVWGLPLNQIDMAATYLGFSVVMLGALRKLGIQATPRESRGVMMLWSYACWLMGVEERWLCFSEMDGVVALNTALMTQSRPDQTSR